MAAKAKTSPASPTRICEAGAFLGAHHDRNEQRTWLVVGVASLMMVAEIAGGSIFGSMALVADGWHMSTHAGALTVAALAYRYARNHAFDGRFAFGTGKVGELAGFASAVVLGVIALLIGWESVGRLVHPRPIHFSEATLIAVIGLLVNLASAWLLHQGDHDHGHSHAAHDHDDDHDHDDHDDHAHDHGREGIQAEVAELTAFLGEGEDLDHQAHHRDNNLRAAYLHVVADALTSVLAISGLLCGWFLGWVWMDPLIGVIGGLVIAQWSWSLMRAAGASLLDVTADPRLPAAVRKRLETAGDKVCDLHLWRLGPGHQALVVSIESENPAEPEAYKARLAGLPGLSHVTVEVNRGRRSTPAAA